MYRISKDDVYSIKRVMSTDFYILKTRYKAMLLDFKLKQFTIQDLLKIEDINSGTESLQVQITPSQIIIAASQS